MNQESQQQLEAILAKHISSVTEPEWAILSARRAYLTEEQLANYFPAKATVSQEAPAPKKKSKVSTPNLD